MIESFQLGLLRSAVMTWETTYSPARMFAGGCSSVSYLGPLGAGRGWSAKGAVSTNATAGSIPAAASAANFAMGCWCAGRPAWKMGGNGRALEESVHDTPAASRRADVVPGVGFVP